MKYEEEQEVLDFWDVRIRRENECGTRTVDRWLTLCVNRNVFPTESSKRSNHRNHGQIRDTKHIFPFAHERSILTIVLAKASIDQATKDSDEATRIE